MVAIGETGLDFYRDHSPRDAQCEAFRRHIELALALRLPLLVHSREAIEECLEILRAADAGVVGGVFHCFAGDESAAKQCLDCGFHISFAGPVTFPKAQNVRTVAKTVPLDSLLLETDCPYLAPQPKRGKRNEPAYVVTSAEVLAQLHEVEVEELAQITTGNACRLLGLQI